MILCDWDAPEGHPGQCCVHLLPVCFRLLSTSLTSVSISLSAFTLGIISVVICSYVCRYLLYRKGFTLPSDWKGSNIKVNFEVKGNQK